MRLRLRLLLTLLRAFFGPRLDLLGTSRLSLMVLPNDVDVFNVTNDRYHAFMDLGRVDLMIRFGLLRHFLRKRYAPVVRFVGMRYTYPARLFQRFQLESRMVCWDNDWVWFEQRFVRHGRTFALAYCKGCAHGRNGRVPNAELLADLGYAGRESPPPTAGIARLQQLEADYRVAPIPEPVQPE